MIYMMGEGKGIAEIFKFIINKLTNFQAGRLKFSWSA